MSPARPRQGFHDPRGVQRALLAWYRISARDLPWRRTRDPYAIWVSEVMLQQTRVETVRRYYGPFLERFPNLEALAASPVDDVLKVWEGLGYYRRARNLHRAAVQSLAAHGGLPPDQTAFRRLPGVGAYTAHAVWAIAFGASHLPLDGNIRRVLARLLDIDSRGDAPLYAGGLPLLENLTRRQVGHLVQALMELGALVCLPRNPDCPNCPLKRRCRAKRRGTVSQRPGRRLRRAIPHHEVVIAYLLNGRGQLLLVQRPPEGLLGGLWELPGGKVETGETLEAALQRELWEEVGIRRLRARRYLGCVEHTYTHLKVTLQLFEGTTRQRGKLGRGPVAMEWIAPEQLGDFTLPRGTHKALALRERALSSGARGNALRR